MKACTLEQVNDQDALPQPCGDLFEMARTLLPGSAIRMAPSLQRESVLLLSPTHHASDCLASGSKGAREALYLPQNWEHSQKAPGSP